MSGHTPEPWALRRAEQGRERAPYIDIYVADQYSEHYGSVASVSAGMSGKARANAARIVACVNALATLTDEALAGGWTYAGQNAYALKLERDVAKWKEAHASALAAVRQTADERDELAAALRVMRDYAARAFDHWDGDEDMKVGKMLLALAGRSKGYDAAVDAALAKVKP